MHRSQEEEGAGQEVCPVKGFGAGPAETTNTVLFSDREATQLPMFPRHWAHW